MTQPRPADRRAVDADAETMSDALAAPPFGGVGLPVNPERPASLMVGTVNEAGVAAPFIHALVPADRAQAEPQHLRTDRRHQPPRPSIRRAAPNRVDPRT